MPNLNLLNEMALDIFNMDSDTQDSYNAILYKAFETAENAKGMGGDVSTETILNWCKRLNRLHGLPDAFLDDIVLEVESRIC